MYVTEPTRMERAEEIGEMLEDCVSYYMREVAGDEPEDVRLMAILCMVQRLARDMGVPYGPVCCAC